MAKSQDGQSEREAAVQVARTEVIERSWGVSRQILAVHSVPVGSDGDPIVVRVDEQTEPREYVVCFPILDQPYYLVVVVGAGKGDGGRSLACTATPRSVCTWRHPDGISWPTRSRRV